MVECVRSCVLKILQEISWLFFDMLSIFVVVVVAVTSNNSRHVTSACVCHFHTCHSTGQLRPKARSLPSLVVKSNYTSLLLHDVGCILVVAIVAVVVSLLLLFVFVVGMLLLLLLSNFVT